MMKVLGYWGFVLIFITSFRFVELTISTNSNETLVAISETPRQ